MADAAPADASSSPSPTEASGGGGGHGALIVVGILGAAAIAGGVAYVVIEGRKTTSKTTVPPSCRVAGTVLQGTPSGDIYVVAVAGTLCACESLSDALASGCASQATSIADSDLDALLTSCGEGEAVPAGGTAGLCGGTAEPCPVQYDGYEQYPYYKVGGYSYAPIVFAAGTTLGEAASILCAEAGGSCDDWPGTIQYYNPQIGSGDLPSTTLVGGQLLLIPSSNEAPVVASPTSLASLCPGAGRVAVGRLASGRTGQARLGPPIRVATAGVL